MAKKKSPQANRRVLFRPVPVWPLEANQKVSVVISCKNEGVQLQKTVDSVLATTFGRPVEIIVVDDGSTDDSCQFLSRISYRSVDYIQGDDLGVAGSRRLGAQQAGGDIIIFLDAHVRCHPGWLENLLLPFAVPAVAAACPRMVNVDVPRRKRTVTYGGTWGRWLTWQSILNEPPSVSEVPLSPGGCTAVRRDVYERIGGHLPLCKGWGWEDQEFSVRLWRTGHRMVVQPHATITHFSMPKGYSIDVRANRRNLLALWLLHTDEQMLNTLLYLWRNDETIPQELPRVAADLDSSGWRERIHAMAVHDLTWFLRKFGIPFEPEANQLGLSPLHGIPKLQSAKRVGLPPGEKTSETTRTEKAQAVKKAGKTKKKLPGRSSSKKRKTKQAKPGSPAAN